MKPRLRPMGGGRWICGLPIPIDELPPWDPARAMALRPFHLRYAYIGFTVEQAYEGWRRNARPENVKPA